MGMYIDPPDGSAKEEWLAKHGDRQNLIGRSWDDCPTDKLPVILVDNGPFTAAGICYCEAEWNAFTLPDDHRMKVLFYVEETLLKPFMHKV